MTIKTPIIPEKQQFAKIDASHEIDLQALCIFAATGFFLDQDTYWKDTVVLPPASICKLDGNNNLESYSPWFKWHNTPRDISFNEALEEYSNLLSTIISGQVQNNNVILPLSGGLDSRTQAIALKRIGATVNAYSYEFQHGYPETKIAKEIANTSGFDFKTFKIPKGYLWNVIDDLSNINKCYSDFCSPRQMAIFNDLQHMHGVMSLGHWGDVLFDDMGVGDTIDLNAQAKVVIHKISKRGGINFANKLWKVWGLKGDFETYFYNRVASLLEQIDIPHSANARIRAFKSLYWAPRWTSVNLSVFAAANPITLPYYDNRMCEFICGLPEEYLSGRRLQIEYIKTHSPQLASLTWDFYHPFNLYTYKHYRSNKGLGQRIYNSLKYRTKLALGKTVVQRNWELQFLGKDNEKHLEPYLFSDNFSEFIPKDFVKEVYNGFKSKEQLQYAHPISMLLTLSYWNQKKEILE